MQDAFFQDMFKLGSINSSRCNGHIPVSSAGKVLKRDRKGCKKGKIEAIMKNNLVSSKARVRIQTAPVVKKIKPVQSSSNHIVKPGTVIKSEYIDSDDPYTFTETEPQVLSLYPGGNNLTLSRKLVPLVSNKTNQLLVNKSGVKMVCLDRDSDVNKVTKLLAERLTPSMDQAVELPSRPFVTKVNHKVVHNLEGSSKTMNKLQADIARNKVMGKRKKMVVSTLSGSGWEERDIKTEPTSNELLKSPVFAKVSVPAKRMHRLNTWQRERKSRHEALQKIQQNQQQVSDLNYDLYPLGVELSDSEGEGDREEENSVGVFQRHWFTGCVRGGRESRLAQVNGELRRRVCQVWRGVAQKVVPSTELVTSVVDAARSHPVSTALLLYPRLKLPSKLSRSRTSMLVAQKCSLDCGRAALPCTRHCAKHIMYNVDQLLFQHCSSRLPDNTQCCTPTFDITHHHPLCAEHAAAYDNSMKLHSDGKPKKSARKKSKPAALTRSNKRGKKKKKPRPSIELNEIIELSEVEVKTEPLIVEEEDGTSINNINQIMLHSSPSSHHTSEVFLTDAAAPISQVEIQVQLEDAVEVVSDEVLAIASLDPTELVNQASRLLEEHDITSMLNQIPPDAFNDIFLEDKNGEYEPTREQTEGLERALEEVDKEVRSLERITGALPLALPLDPINLLDDVGGYVTYPNGYVASHDLRHTTSS